MLNVLLTDAYWRKSLSALRALSKEGLAVGVGERTLLSQGLFSRYCNKRYVYPSVSLRPLEFLSWLEKIIEKEKYEVLITPEEETQLLIAKNINRFNSKIKIPIPKFNKINFVRNKLRLLLYAEKLGIPCPKFQDKACFPMVIKPIIGTGARGIKYINSAKELIQDKNFLIQEYIPGHEYYGVSVIFNRQNKMRSAFVHKKIRQFPVTGGCSTYAISAQYPLLVDITEKILSKIGWHGVANAEFKIDSRDGLPKLMEINPRLWGSLELAVSSGVNFPYMLYELALTGDIKPKFDYEVGKKFRWIMHGDFLNFISNFNWDFFNFFEKNTTHAVWSIRDPLPIFGNMLSLIDFLTSKEMKKFRD